MSRLAAVLPALALLAGLPSAASPGTDPLTWLQRAASSARESNYAGTIMHVTGDHTSTSRIAHVLVDGSEREKIDSLDGPRREIVRRDDELQCFYPDAKTVRVDRRVTARFFPSLVRGPVEAIAENYRLALGHIERVLGQECQWIDLDPKDALRYAQRLCAELGSGLLLRAKTLGAKHEVLDQFAFTDLRVGSQVSPGEVKGSFRMQSRHWRRDIQPRNETTQVESEWTVAQPPPGFRLVSQMQRMFPNRPKPVTQLVLSDGLASMSVFIEPMPHPPRTTEATNQDGALSVFVRPMGEQLVTVLGEVPTAAAEQVGRSIARQAAPVPEAGK